ncbi:Krueppel homolog 2 [Neocloeon triangulifer]|uniref:Krueppel homolog 2 n=1 Tax=Neocloeon triangulifer TaxID=2078957 RepID=UPI00286F435B|nr:Krueppel homolog 2 [Neocloeon triangulifer]
MSSDANSGPDSAQQESRPAGNPLNWNGLVDHIKAHKLDFALWCTRVCTIFFTIMYFIPLTGNAYSCYYKALMANAATSALRLHLRLPQVQLSQQFFAQLVAEDSCHYLFFSLIFLYVSPLALVLLPVVLFAMLHSASYSLTLLDQLGQNSWWGARMLISLVEFQSVNILRMVAFTEILLMPFVFIMIFLGKAGLLTPFIYYNFLTLRYSSRRNPYTRNMFREIRVNLENVANKPSFPAFLKGPVHSGIALVSRLAPRQVEAQPTDQ